MHRLTCSIMPTPRLLGWDGKEFDIEAPLPRELQAALEHLENDMRDEASEQKSRNVVAWELLGKKREA